MYIYIYIFSDVNIVPIPSIIITISLKGVALLFLTKAEELSKERGYKYVRIDTNSCNTNMQKLIPKGGYTFKGECSLPGKIEGLKYYCYEKIIS
jgi:hypothetical protein